VDVSDLLEVLDALEDLAVDYWLDGGWGVDCLLGGQTRTHGDLDLVVPRLQVERVRTLLASRGFTVIRDWLPTAVAFRDARGREVDLHPVDPTADGGGLQRLPGGATWHYGPPVEGSVNGRIIRCASAEEQLLMHQGYEPRPVDVLDMRRIGERFGLPLPAPFSDAVQPWRSSQSAARQDGR
jgi:lincosamide nucleotidyltransferase A/C/D/E